jgi:putative transposase
MTYYETISEALAQGNPDEARSLFQDLMRTSARLALLQLMEEEVNQLCGAKYSRQNPESACRRAGSEKGIAYINGTREDVIRPRVRDGEGEVKLTSYETARDQSLLFDQVVEAVAAGMPVRGVEDCHGGAVKRTQASQMWVQRSAEVFEEFRSRSLAGEDWLALQLDGVFIRDQCIIIALGVTADGRKMALDFEVGASESFESARLLCERLVGREFRPGAGRRLLVVRDGSKALAKAVRRIWPDAVQQECLVHLERQTLDKLPKRAREDAARLFRRLRMAQGAVAGEEAFDTLLVYLEERNGEAADCLRTRRDHLLAFHRLDVSSSLNGTFTNTNHIENLIRNWRHETNRVKRWDPKTGQLSRWTAVGLMEAEKGFRRVRGHGDLPGLLEALSASDGGSVPGSSAGADKPSTPPPSEELATGKSTP